MKANELMIGDWVYYNPNVFIEDEYEPTKPIKITKITSGEDIDLAIEGCYSPIPLTAEILEKNGFVRNVWNIYTAPTCCLSVERVKGYFFLRLGTLQLCKIEYVQELQHFLRDFKTNKEITL